MNKITQDDVDYALFYLNFENMEEEYKREMSFIHAQRELEEKSLLRETLNCRYFEAYEKRKVENLRKQDNKSLKIKQL